MTLLQAAIAAVLAVVVTGDPPPAPRPTLQATIGDVAWLTGDWVGRDGENFAEERWTPPAGGGMLALARTVKGDQMVQFEYLRIVPREKGLVYIAQPGGRPPVEFVLTKRTRQSVTFENPGHDFPTMVQYALRDNGVLEATIGNAGAKMQTYRFVRRH